MDDWQIGDLALCVQGGKCTHTGAIYTVTGVLPGGTRRRAAGKTWLNKRLSLLFAEFPDYGTSSCALRFRKIRPLSDEERDSFLADLDAPLSTPEPSEVAPADAALNARVGHFSPLGALPGSLPGPSAVDTSRHADGSGLLFNRAHAVEVPNG